MTPSGEIYSLGDVLDRIGQFDPTACLYLPTDAEWTLSSPCSVLPTSDIDGVPVLAEKHGLAYAIGVDAVQDVVSNASQQKPALGSGERLAAFLYYYDNDAFIEL